jgi:hypothetical protein
MSYGSAQKRSSFGFVNILDTGAFYCYPQNLGRGSLLRIVSGVLYQDIPAAFRCQILNRFALCCAPFDRYIQTNPNIKAEAEQFNLNRGGFDD